MDGSERRVGLIGANIRKGSECEIAAGHGAGDFLQRPDLRRRQTEPRQPGGARPQDGPGLERIECRGEPSPDRTGARGRKLLRHHGRDEAGETVGPSPQRRPTRFGDKRAEPRFGLGERGERRVEVELAANMRQHVRVRA